MTDCPSCGAALKEDDWTCGRCGAPVAGAGLASAPGTGGGAGGAPPGSSGSSSEWLPEYRPQPATAAAPERSGSSGLLRLVIIIAVVAIVAIVAVWFFVLRGPSTSGEEFLGTWTTTQQGITTAEIARSANAFSLTLSGSQESQKFTVPARLDGADLVVTMEDFSQIAGESNAERFKEALKALAGDFRMVFSSVDATHLSLRIVGTSASGDDFDETIPLTKEAAGTT